MSSKIQKIGQCGFVIISFALLLYRITLHADVADEITNLNISYRISLGAIPFYHSMEPYQAGDLFLVPFLWLFTKITGSTTGIVLYSRVVYIVVLSILTVLTYKMFSRYMEKTTAFFLSYVIVFFEIYSLFYIWYDTASIIFFLLGDLAIVNALENSKSQKKKYLFLALAGLCHSCMVISHVALIPMALGIAVLIAILVYRYYDKKISSALKCVLAYGSVPIVAALIVLLVAQIVIGLDTLFEMLGGILATRGSINFNILEWVGEIITTYFNVNSYFIPVSIILLLVYILVWKWPKLYIVLAMGIVLLPIYNQIEMEESIDKGLANYLSYIALWAPFLYGMIRKKEKLDRCLMYIFCIPILFSAVLIPMLSITGSRGPIKSWQMCLPGALAALYYLIRVWKEKYVKATLPLCNILLMVVSATLLFNSYTYNFLNEPLIEANDNRMTEGIYWGIKVKPHMESMAEIQKLVEKYSEGCETVVASGGIKCIYLMTDLKPFAKYTESAAFLDGQIYQWDELLEYFEYFNDLPDVMFLEPCDLVDDDIWNLIKAHYEEMTIANIGDYTITVYRRLDSGS